MSEDPITSDMLNDVRWEIPLVIEEIGAIAAFLREAISDADAGNVRGSAMVASDCMEAFGTLESRLSKMAATVFKWQEYAEQESGDLQPEEYEDPRIAEGDYRRDEMLDRKLEEKWGEA